MTEPREVGHGQVVIAHYDDILFREGRALALEGSQVMLVSELSAAALRHAEAGITVGALSELLADEFGAPPGELDVFAATRQLVGDLADSGLLELR